MRLILLYLAIVTCLFKIIVCQEAQTTNSSNSARLPEVVVSQVLVSTAPVYITKPSKLPSSNRTQNQNRRQRQLSYADLYNYGVNYAQYSPAAYPQTVLNQQQPQPQRQRPEFVFPKEHPAYSHALRNELNTPQDLGFLQANGAFAPTANGFTPANNGFMEAFTKFISSLSGPQTGQNLKIDTSPARTPVPLIPTTGTGPALYFPSSGFGVSGPSAPIKTGVTWANPPRRPPPPPQEQCTPNPVFCDPKTPYRTLDGSCNNLKNTMWGRAGAKFIRLLPPRYADGIQAPLDDGFPLPRVLSFSLFPNVEIADQSWTLAAMQWAQFITHDMSMAAGSRQHKPHAIRCCAQDGHDVVNNLAEQFGCYPVRIPRDDPFYAQHNQRCMDFVRSSNDVANGCSNGPAEQMTAVSSYLDLSLVYGSNDDTLRNLREYNGGRMIVARRKGDDWLPPSTNRSADCETADDDEPCYRSGDVRVNQNPGQAILQTLFLREHNRIATILSTLNHHWDDETLFQEARRINIAQVQQITYYEWLPILLGIEETERRGLVQPYEQGYSNDYDENTDATAINDHATGAFRHLHTLIPSQLVEVDAQRNGLQAYRLSDVFNRPSVIETKHGLDQLVRGLAAQPQHAPDRFFSAEITQFLFRAGKPFGGDLRSVDVQRGRDHGLPGYNAYRELCGLPKARSFQDFADVMDVEATQALSQLYNNPDDVDMLVGGGLEKNTPGALAGPTFICIMAEQFRRARQGDRFWYELGNQAGSFTPGQLQELRKASLSRIMCDNAKGVKSMQLRAFQQIGFRNPLLPCSEVPAIDLTFWDAHDPNDLPTAHAQL